MVYITHKTVLKVLEKKLEDTLEGEEGVGGWGGGRGEAGTHWSGEGEGGLRGGGRLTLLLNNCSLKGFGTGKFFWPILLVGCGWLLLIHAL